jgi:hypothetical protein
VSNLTDIAAIRARFLSQWDQSITVLFENEAAIETPTTLWGIMSVNPGFERRASIGATRRYEQLGRIYLKLTDEERLNDERIRGAAEAFANIFRDWNSPDYKVRCDTPEYRSGTDEKGNFYIIVSIPYTAQH